MENAVREGEGPWVFAARCRRRPWVHGGVDDGELDDEELVPANSVDREAAALQLSKLLKAQRRAGHPAGSCGLG